MTPRTEKKQLSKAAAIAIIVAAVLLALSLASCKTIKEIEVHEVVIRDTIIEHSTDTLRVDRVKHDSINVYILDTSYVDAVGTQHHDRKEIRYNSSSVSNEEYRSVLADNERLRSQVEELKNEKEVVKEVEKKVYVWWPFAVVIGVIVAGCTFMMARRKPKKNAI